MRADSHPGASHAYGVCVSRLLAEVARYLHPGSSHAYGRSLFVSVLALGLVARVRPLARLRGSPRRGCRLSAPKCQISAALIEMLPLMSMSAAGGGETTSDLMPSGKSSASGAATATRLIYAAVCVDYFAVGMMRTLLPFYGKQLGGTPVTQGALEALYGAGQVVGSVILGKWSDQQGRKAGLAVSFAGSAIGYALVAVSVSGVAGEYSLPLLLCSRVPVGLAKQTITISRAVIADVTEPAGRSVAMQRLYSAMAAGYIVGPSFGGCLATYSGGGDSGGSGSTGATASSLPAIFACALFLLPLPTVAFLLPETITRNTKPVVQIRIILIIMICTLLPTVALLLPETVTRILTPGEHPAEVVATKKFSATEAKWGMGVLASHPKLALLIAAQWLPECAFVGFTSTALGTTANADSLRLHWGRSHTQTAGRPESLGTTTLRVRL
ncbi:major facilitator superfamily domain-containing protein [Pavlovales sp. CCMP2436]|nr:major facilitator superfamily domain-containing protein [Pavlovales sp. CCMP2436]